MSKNLSLWALLLCAAAAACSAPPPAEETGDVASEVGRPRWKPVETVAPNGFGSYDDLGRQRCSGGLRPGARELGNMLKRQFDFASYGGYACRRNTADRSKLSIHAVGRALDLMTRDGDDLANHIVKNANALGVQLVIWNRTLWKITPNGPSSRAYRGRNPHTDHIHVELTREAAEAGPEEVAVEEDPTDEEDDDLDDG